MTRYRILAFFALLTAFLAGPAQAQWDTHESVLAKNDWYKIGVTGDGVYGLDYATLQSLGVDMGGLDPARIRLFGNVQGPLPEANASERYDDLSEAAILVTGAEDGSFDEGDRILFYGQGPVNMVRASLNYYSYERNPYTDTVYYFLCVNAEQEGLRIQDQASVVTGTSDPVIEIFPDYLYHESEEVSPYASGRAWYGDLFTGQEGCKEFHFEIPGSVQESGIRVESHVLGRCKPSAKYNLLLNEVRVVAHRSFEAYESREYGKEHSINKMAYPFSDTLTLRYEFDPFEGNPMLFIDYFVLNFWRSLRYEGPDFAFRLMSSQMMTSPSTVVVANANASVSCWDVTDPLHPCRQLTEAHPQGLSFGLEGYEERRYHLFETEGVKPIASCRAIPNQNLHGLDDAEFLIITPKVFWTQAQELADFHVEHDGMDCLVTDVEEIYNEFGTGTPDPTAIRDFIRMLYLRSEGRLQYVLLMGKGSHDFRGCKGMDNHFIPTYETAGEEFYEVASMCSDDYFALMDEDEGENCNGKVDLGVGRIPITSPEQGDAVIRKIKHYANPDHSWGLWKNEHLLMADNDSHYYPDYTEDLAKVLDTAWPIATVKKLYLDSYPVVSTSSGTRVPMAHDALMEYFDKGINVLSYTGHGGVKSLSAEWVLALTDIQSMTNFDRLPFVHTATCEFSKFDDPGVVSGGELMLLNPNGGAIALLTTVRPTLSQNNQKISRSLHEHLYDKNNNQHLRIGDVYRIVKSDPRYYSRTNIVYVLFGDPALRLAYPTHRVVTEQVEGDDLLTVRGSITTADGTFDSQFNGVLELRLYDQASNFTTLGQYDNPVNYSYHHDILFEGKASVSEGWFEARIPVPATVSLGNGSARLSYSAYDSVRRVEANGYYDNLHVEAPSSMTDTQGPELRLYWNTPDFESGDVVSPFGTLYADLYDENGIYHYNVSIGRDIVMNSSMSAFDNLILNDRYEPVVDDYQSGRIVIPMNELEDGPYTFALKAWDTRNNSTEVEIMMTVERSVLISQMRLYPNPFAGEVWFSFVDGEMTEDLEVVLEVFDVMGRRVAMVQEQTSSVAGVVPALRWDGKATGGRELRPGVYACKISITAPEGKTRVVTHSLIKQ